MGFPGAAPYNGKSLIEENCDILLPCAKECVITRENAPRIKAKVSDSSVGICFYCVSLL